MQGRVSGFDQTGAIIAGEPQVFAPAGLDARGHRTENRK